MAITRRNLLERSGALALSSAVWPSWMPRMVFRSPDADPSGDIMIVIFARGGYDGLNMVIPYGNESEYMSYRRNIGIAAPDATAANKAIDLDGFFGIHPALGGPNLGRWKELYDEGVLGIVHAVHMQDPTRSHFDAQDFMERGTPGQKALNSGWLGRHLQTKASQRNSPFRAVGMGTMVQASLRGPVPAVALQSIADFHLQGRQTEIQRFQQHLASLYSGDGWLDHEGQTTFSALELLAQAINTSTYKAENGAKYADNGFARGLMQIAQLIKADVGLAVGFVDIGGWDTHANQVNVADTTTGSHADQMNVLASAVTAFVTDLWPYFDKSNKGKQGITVMVMSEFGRRIGENGGRGTDHGHGNVMFLVGKGINGGKVYTNPWPGLAEDQQDRGDLKGTTEYRDVLAEILSKRAGNKNVSQVFPNKNFSFLGLATPLDVSTVPTPAPTKPAPTPVPTAPVEVPTHKIHLPWLQKG
jgi:uncharacterized protein (DUF1501 family)